MEMRFIIPPLNLNDGIPFGNEVFDCVYHSHLLEHFSKSYAPIFMSECYRILKPGGVIRVVVPDFEKMAILYIDLLKKSIEGDIDSIKKYEWITIEMFDQMVRNSSGGEMLDYWKKNPMPDILTPRS